jgi:RNA recognition motif-containing protein
MNILVRNLDRSITDDKIKELFRPFGTITSVTIVHDQRTGESKGFGFVDMPNQAEAEAAIKSLNLTKILKERIRVKAAIPKSGTGSISEHIKLQTAADQTAAARPAPAIDKPSTPRARTPFPSHSAGRPEYKKSFKKPYRTDSRDDSRPRFTARREDRPSSSAGKPYSSTAKPYSSTSRPASPAGKPEYRPRSERPYSASGKTGFAPRNERGTGYQGSKSKSFRSAPAPDRATTRFPYRDGAKPASLAANPFSRFTKKSSSSSYASADKPAYSPNRPSTYTGKYDLNKKSTRPFSRFPKRDGSTPSTAKTFAKTRFHKS